ncbi:MAG TPA: AraC family transcriptional regulator [Pyrinomonadaceae bacterium]|nr:AraC family transcriptional regulator [Pyrinomonadaceae bacterium]
MSSLISTTENSQDPNWRGKVFLWQEQALFLGEASNTSFHASPGIKIIIALDGEFLLKTSEDGEWQNFKSAIVAPGQFHKINGRNNKLALIVLVPEAKVSQPLLPILSRKGISRIPVGVVQNFLPIFEEFDKMSVESVESEKICRKMFEKIKNGEKLLSAEIDKRISKSIERLRQESENQVSVSEVAANVALSESRFSHLFTEQVGVSVRRYQLWLRLREAIHLLANSGGSLTDTAHEAGFSDSAHLTRTFRQMLGIAPSALLKHSTLFVFPE